MNAEAADFLQQIEAGAAGVLFKADDGSQSRGGAYTTVLAPADSANDGRIYTFEYIMVEGVAVQSAEIQSIHGVAPITSGGTRHANGDEYRTVIAFSLHENGFDVHELLLDNGTTVIPVGTNEQGTAEVVHTDSVTGKRVIQAGYPTSGTSSSYQMFIFEDGYPGGLP